MIINNNSLEALRECKYNKCDIGYVSDNAYMSIVMTNKCQKKCFYCINSNTDQTLQLPIEKALVNINKFVDKYGIKEAVLLGGEPTTHPQLFEFIEGLKKTNLERFGITTNGLCLRNHEFVDKLCSCGLSWINISIDSDDDLFLSKENLEYLYNKENRPKIRINTNVYRGNHDNHYRLIEFLMKASPVCDEFRVSNLIEKDSFSVNTVQNDNSRILSKDEYKELFQAVIDYYQDVEELSVIYNPKALGFVEYYLIPTRKPIIINWNLDSEVADQICENDLENRKVHTFKCLVNGEISLSWNTGNVLKID